MASVSLLAATPGTADDAPHEVGLGEILDNPAAFHGQTVRAHGFLLIQFEGQALWATEADFQSMAYERAAWLDLMLLEPEDYDHPLNGRLAFVTGVVDADGEYGGHGHGALFGTTITDITEIEPDPADTAPARLWRTDQFSNLLAGLGFLALVFTLIVGAVGFQNRLRKRG